MDYRHKTIRVRAPLFDRLIDLEPKSHVDKKSAATLDLYQLQDSIQKEVARILNSRDTRVPYSLRAGLGQASDNTARPYGIPDFAKYDTSNELGRKKWYKRIKSVIEQYEPRITDVKVRLVKHDKGNNNLVIALSGKMKADPIGHRFIFPVMVQNADRN